MFRYEASYRQLWAHPESRAEEGGQGPGASLCLLVQVTEAQPELVCAKWGWLVAPNMAESQSRGVTRPREVSILGALTA